MPIYSGSGSSTNPTNVNPPYDFTEDSAHVSGNAGAFVLAVRNDAGTALAADGDYIPFTTDSSGALRVAASVAITYAYAEDSVHVSGDSGAFVLAVRNQSSTVLTSADGDYSPIAVDQFGRIRTNNAFDYNEDSNHTSGEIGAFVLAVRNDAGTNLVSADGDYAPLQVDSTGALRVAASVAITYDYAEDSAHVSGDQGAFILAVRNDTPGSLVDTNGDYAPLQVDSAGALRVAASVAINYAYAEDTVHVSGDIGSFSLGVRNDAAATLTSADGDYSPFATDAAGRIGISDLGGSISIDGTVSISGTVDTELPAAVALADGMANPTVPQVGAHGMVFNGTTWDRVNGRPSNTDAQASDGEGGIEVIDRNYVYNGTNWDRVRSAGSIGAIQVGGTAAHDSAVAGNPVAIGSRAQDDNTTITSVAAGDATFNLADLKGVQFMKEQRPQLLGIYYGIFGPSQLNNAADGATVGRMWLVNTSATIAAAIRYVSFEAVLASTTAMLTFPRITVERMTFTGTPTGASITPAFRASTDATNTATIRTASTGMTITAGAGIHNFIPPLSLTGVGTISIPEQKLNLSDHADGRVILGQNQGIVIRQADGGSPNDNRRFFISIAWEEYTV